MPWADKLFIDGVTGLSQKSFRFQFLGGCHLSTLFAGTSLCCSRRMPRVLPVCLWCIPFLDLDNLLLFICWLRCHTEGIWRCLGDSAWWRQSEFQDAWWCEFSWHGWGHSGEILRRHHRVWVYGNLQAVSWFLSSGLTQQLSITIIPVHTSHI